MMKLRNKVLCLCLASCILLQSGPVVLAGAPQVSVDESLYVNLDYYGETDQVSVVKGCNLNGNDSFTDYGHYQTVTNMSNYAQPIVDDESITWNLTEDTNRRFYYEGTFSGKSGNTSEAGSTLVTTVTRNNMTLICVVLKAADGGQSVADTTALMDYGYNNFTLTDVSVQNQERTGNVILPNGIDFSSLIEDTDAADSTFHYSYQGHFMGSAVSNIEEKTAETNDISSVSTVSPSPVISEPSENENFFTPAHIIMIILVVMILAGIFCIFLGLKKSKKKNRKRR